MRRDDSDFIDSPHPFPSYEWRGYVKRCVDGDTIVVQIDRGFFDSSTKEFRFAAFNAPERSGEEKALGDAAWKLLQSLIENQFIRFWTMMDPDKYGRILVDTILNEMAEDVFQIMRERGFDKLKVTHG